MSFFDKLKRLLGLSKTYTKEEHRVPRDDYSYNEMKAKKQEQVDFLLDKIQRKGIESLTGKERAFLDKESRNI